MCVVCVCVFVRACVLACVNKRKIEAKCKGGGEAKGAKGAEGGAGRRADPKSAPLRL